MAVIRLTVFFYLKIDRPREWFFKLYLRCNLLFKELFLIGPITGESGNFLPEKVLGVRSLRHISTILHGGRLFELNRNGTLPCLRNGQGGCND